MGLNKNDKQIITDLIKDAMTAATGTVLGGTKKNSLTESSDVVNGWKKLKSEYLEATLEGVSPGELERINATAYAKIKNLMHMCRADSETHLFREMKKFSRKVYI